MGTRGWKGVGRVCRLSVKEGEKSVERAARGIPHSEPRIAGEIRCECKRKFRRVSMARDT